MTARGAYLKMLVDPETGSVSVRELAKRLAERLELPDDPEYIRRTLQRHMRDGNNGRDVSNKYVAAISDVLGIDPEEWPASRPRSDATLRRRVAELEEELHRVRYGDPPAPAQDGEP